MKFNVVCAGIGAVGMVILGALGGWTDALITLFIFMAIDYTSGIICACIFKKSKKTTSGKLSSKACLLGIIKKVGELVLVIIAVRLDMLTGATYIKDGTIIALVVYEGISIIENLGLMGVPIPAIITNTIDVLKGKDDKNVQ